MLNGNSDTSGETCPILLTIDGSAVEARIADIMALTGETEEDVVLKALLERYDFMMTCMNQRA